MSILPENVLKEPRTRAAIKWRALNPTVVWVASMSQVPVVGMVRVVICLPFSELYLTAQIMIVKIYDGSNIS